MNIKYEGQSIAGFHVYTNIGLTVPGTPYEVRRHWGERLFSKPWQPWKATRTVVPQEPDPQMYVLGEFAVVGHPITVRRVLEVLQKYQRHPFAQIWERI